MSCCKLKTHSSSTTCHLYCLYPWPCAQVLLRIVPDLESCLLPLEECIYSILIPVLTGRVPPSDVVQDLLVLPARLGDLGLVNPASSCSSEYLTSTAMSQPLATLILTQSKDYPYECISAQLMAKAEASKLRRRCKKETASTIRGLVSDSLQRAMELAQEKGASSWLTYLPIQEFGLSF